MARLTDEIVDEIHAIRLQHAAGFDYDIGRIIDDLQVSHNPMGSLTTPSAVIVPGPKVMTWDDWVGQKTVVGRRTKRKEAVPEGQMGLGF